MTRDPLDVDVQPVSPDSAEAHLVLDAYFRDIMSRQHRRRAISAGWASGCWKRSKPRPASRR